MKIPIRGPLGDNQAGQKTSKESDMDKTKEMKAGSFFQPNAEAPFQIKKNQEPRVDFERTPETSREQESQMGQRPSEFPRKEKASKSDNVMANKVIDLVVKVSIYLTVFLTPLFFLPIVPSVVELNKQAFLVAIVGIGFLAWIGKMAWKNEIRFKSGFVLVPVIIFLLIYGLSTIFSTYPEQSLWGYFGGESYSFISLLFFVALFLLIFNNVKNREEAVKVVMVFLLGSFLVGLVGILQLWGKNIFSSELTKSSSFNTIGSVYLFGIYIAASFLMTIALFVSNVPKIFKIILIILSFFFFFILMVINFKWMILIVSMAILFGMTIIHGEKSGNQARVLPMIFIVLSLLMFLRKQPIIQKQMPVEVLLNSKTSYKIMLSSLKENPLLGVGPANYTSVYKMNRPDNLGDFWSVNFTTASSYFATLISTTGILGALAFILLSVTGLVYFLKSMVQSVSSGAKEESEDYVAVGVGVVWVYLTFILFTYLGNMSILMLWWLSFALFLSFSLFDPRVKIKEFVTTSATPRSSLLLSFVFVLIIIGLVAAIYLQSQKYVAAANFNKALKLDVQGESIQEVADKVNLSIQLDPNRDIYYRNLSIAMFALANQRVAEKKSDLTPEDSNYVSKMIRGALQSADRAKQLNPSNSENYISLANIYEGMLLTMDKADENAIESYGEAIERDPNNPALYHRMANIFVTLADMETQKAAAQSQGGLAELPEQSQKYFALAKEKLDKAIELKADFVAAHLLYAGIYEREGDIDLAIEKEKENKKLFSRDPGIALRLGLLYYRNQQFEEAKNEFEYALILDQNYANAMYFLGLSYYKLSDSDRAIKQFEKVSELNPDNEDVKTIINNLNANRDPLEGLGQSTEESPIGESQTRGTSKEPGIDPGVENVEIPKEATPSPDEVENTEEIIGPEEQPAE